MKILHVYKTYFPDDIGGIERFILSLSNELSKEGIQSDVLTTGGKNKAAYKFSKTNVLSFPRTLDLFSCPISLGLISNLKKIAEDYDLIHYHFPWPFGDFAHLISRVNKPAVLTYHSDIVRQPKILQLLYTPIMKRFLNKVSRIAVTSNNLLVTSPTLKSQRKKCTVIPIGMDKDLYPTPTEAQLNSWREKLGTKFFLFVGVLRYYKGLEYLLDAVKNSDIPLVIAGSGPEERKLHDLAFEHNITNIVFLGRVTEEDKTALLTLCKAVIAPAHLRSEAFCISLLEGLMHGKPLISTELGTGTSFVNEHMTTGLVVNPKSSDELAVAIRRLQNEPELYDKLQQGAKQRYERYFNGNYMRTAYLKLYESVLGKTKTTA